MDSTLPGLLDKFSNVCKCSKCMEDMKAIALNNLKPWYVVTEKGQVFVKVHELECQFRTDILRELISAIEKVSNNERHI